MRECGYVHEAYAHNAIRVFMLLPLTPCTKVLIVWNMNPNTWILAEELPRFPSDTMDPHPCDFTMHVVVQPTDAQPQPWKESPMHHVSHSDLQSTRILHDNTFSCLHLLTNGDSASFTFPCRPQERNGGYSQCLV